MGKTSKSSATATTTPKAALKKAVPLTTRVKRFCEFVASGISGTEAWIKAGHKCNREAARAAASRALARANVQDHLNTLRKTQTKRALLSKEDKREILRDIIDSATQKTQDRLRAIEIDAKLAGDFAPEKHILEDGPERIKSARERAMAVASPLNRLASKASG